jgi:Glycosyl hydrolases family 2, sugar binding domain/Glycosyl hydrolases family 2, TIM barrel domain/Glycosyl hydrolases family 2
MAKHRASPRKKQTKHTTAHLDPLNNKAYPRPMLQRSSWMNLNGSWDFAIDTNAQITTPVHVDFDRTIVVPYAPETPASGVADTSYYNAIWYRRTIDRPELSEGDRAILHFGAVDYSATVWVNDQLAATHEGGYTPFSADITDLLNDEGEQTIVVRAYDDPHDVAQPRGKQDWLLEPHSIWYPRTTGIWQTVWLEIVPATHVEYLRWTPRLDRWEIQLDATITGPVAPGLKLQVKLSAKAKTLVDDVYTIGRDQNLSRTIHLTDPGIDSRNELFWFPHAPNLIDVELTLKNSDGETIDTVTSYTAMRGVSLHNGKFELNGRPYKLQMVLDQGYWPDTGLSAPDDAALRRDVELLKAMGFNGVRKHQKIEDPRFLYWADHLGLIVWEEMPSAYIFSARTVERISKQWMEAMHRDVSHPCIVAWVPFNESWGVPDLLSDQAQCKFVAGVYNLTNAIDPMRPCIGNDGWETVPNATDIIAVHDYERDPQRIPPRYVHNEANLDHLFKHETPGNMLLLLPGYQRNGEPIMLTEFGGIAYSKDHEHTWGYIRAMTAEAFTLRYFNLMQHVRSVPLFAGWCYTQFTDTYQEANGLLYMDRTPKIPIEQIAVATRGAQSEEDRKIEAKWKKELAKQE